MPTISIYSRLADVPHLQYPGIPTVQRTRLRLHRAKYVNEQWYLGRTVLFSPPPTMQLAFRLPFDGDYTALRGRLQEALELPGRVCDYLRVLEAVCSLIYDQQTEAFDLATLHSIERVALLGIRLILAVPDEARFRPAPSVITPSPPPSKLSSQTISTYKRLLLARGHLQPLTALLDQVENVGFRGYSNGERNRLMKRLDYLIEES